MSATSKLLLMTLICAALWQTNFLTVSEHFVVLTSLSPMFGMSLISTSIYFYLCVRACVRACMRAGGRVY